MSAAAQGTPTVGAVVIGRNEGARLIACLTSLQDHVGRIVYVDSGSNDGSQDAARKLGVHVVDLDVSVPFTAARARNAGLAALMAETDPPALVQFVDGDCTLDAGWIAVARAFLQEHAEVAVVCGRRRERFPDASLYNRLIDLEWDTPVGEALACGGDALMRTEALAQVDGFNPALIAGEEPELCVRLRAKGWKIWRIDAEMTLHDAALTRFGQWWMRTKRAGHAYAEGAALHGDPPERHNVAQTNRALLWGLWLPLILVGGGLMFGMWVFVLGALIYPVQALRLRARGHDLVDAAFLTLGKFPEALGVLSYHWRKRVSGKTALIEYK